ncbi:MAG: HD family hydrolase [Pseudomonadota bacterium]
MARITPPRAWQRMLSGRRLDLLDPSPLDVELEDIAHGLARVARWNGQTAGEHAFSVAQHSILVAQIVGHLLGKKKRESQLYALVHDAPEYVIGDMISPFKSVMGGAYKDVEARLAAAIHLRLGLAATPPAALKKTIKKADQILAYFEATKLAGFELAEARDLFGKPHGVMGENLDLSPWPAQVAQRKLLDALASAEQLP